MPSKGNGPDEKSEEQPAIFEEVLDAEIAYFTSKHPLKRHTGAESDNGTHSCDSEYAARVVKKAHEAKLSGIAFSGGGIRSATFNLGVLQALARFKLLEKFNYLSTVSGGGYIGSWLAAWISRENQNRRDSGEPPDAEGTDKRDGVERVTAKLAAAAGEGHDREPHGAMQPDPSPIWHLREYSNYLTPRRGALSTDAWTFFIAYIRNFFLTLGVLLGTVVALVLFAQAYASGFDQILDEMPKNSEGVFNGPSVLFTLLMSGASLFLGIELSPHRARSAKTSILAYIAIALVMGAAAAGSLWLVTLSNSLSEFTKLFAVCGMLIVGVMTLGFAGRWFGNHGLFGDALPEDREASKGAILWLLGGSVLALVILVVLWWWAALWMPSWSSDPDLEYLHVAVWGVLEIVGIFSVAAAVFVGFAGSALKELEREWLARFFAAIAKWTFLYTMLMALVVYSHYLVQELPEFGLDTIRGYLKPVLGGLWGILSALGAYFARKSSSNTRWLGQTLVVVTPLVFILGLLIITVWGTTHAVHVIVTALLHDTTFGVEDKVAWLGELSFFANIGDPLQVPAARELLTMNGYWAVCGTLGLLVSILTVFWSRRVGVNDFSLHALYGSRLIRAYLGASNLHRRAHPFTGFDSADNSVRMSELMTPADGWVPATAGEKKTEHKGPYLIVNAAVNLVNSHRLAWQKRKAASFTFTPQFCGYEFCDEDNDGQGTQIFRTGGYAESSYYGGVGGVSLGKAMTISGAAASPNMGYHSSPALGFLMTIFNVRLGWWLPNTAMFNTGLLCQRGPAMGLMYLITEALGLTDARKDYVYLSDGGHFENLGIYELVRRRCRLVIACDAEADPDMTFSGLGNAIQKCRIDLGVPINIDVSQIRRDAATGKSRWHCAIGCIRYSEADPGNHDGALLYIKASLTGDEPQDVATYAQAHPSFPHESTADQWFDESQFESYRELGEHIATQVLANAVDIAEHGRYHKEYDLERIFLELRKQWYPHVEPANVKPADHDRLLQELLERLRKDEKLQFLGSQLYPNLQRIIDIEANGGEQRDETVEASKDELQAGVYISDEKLVIFDPQLIPSLQPVIDRSSDSSGGKKRGDETGKVSKDELRSGFYFSKELIQFMQTVFHDRRLDTEYAAPSNRGWMNLFRRWALSRMFRFTWAATAGTYSARFQSFCEFHLSLDSGEPCIDVKNTLELYPEYPAQADSSQQKHKKPKDESHQDTNQKMEVHAVEGGKSDEAKREWLSGDGTTGLHRYECCVIDEFISAYAHNKHIKLLGEHARFTVLPLKLKVDNVSRKNEGGHTHLNAGFFLIGPSLEADSFDDRVVLFFRIRSSMRNMDLARRAFIEIRKQEKDLQVCLIHELPKGIPPGDDSDLLRRRAYREVHRLDRENLERCRWFAQLLADTTGEQADEAGSGQPGDETTAGD